ncbi:hypothetical protein Tco_1315329 [Tanacetum coccineum]
MEQEAARFMDDKLYGNDSNSERKAIFRICRDGFTTRTEEGNPHKLTEDLGIVDSGCSRSMTGNKHRLENFQEFKGGNVTFGGGEGKITGKGTIRISKSFQTPSTNAVTPGSTPLTPGTPVTPDSAPFATSTSPDILSAGASSLRYPHPSTFANEFATGIPILKDIYDNPGSGMFTSSSYDDQEPRADLTNMSSTENVNPTSSKRVKSAHPSSLIIGDIASPVQTRSRVNKSSNGESALVCYIKD